MERKSFFKALFGLIVAPSIIKDIDWAIPKVQTTGALFAELNRVITTYYADYIEKYGSESYVAFFDEFAKPITITKQ